MSAGFQRVAGGLLIPESAMDVPTEDGVGIRAKAGVLQTATKGGAWATIGGAIVDPPYNVSVATQNYDIAGLSGDTDGDYILSGRIILPNGVTPVITLQPNQIAANQDALIAATAASGAPATSLITTLMIDSFATDAAGTPYVWFMLRMTALTGRVRRFISEGKGFTGTSTNVRHRVQTEGDWSDTTTVITNLRIAGGVANAIQPGSFFVLQRTGINT